MSLVGLDLNSTRLRAVAGPRNGSAAPVRLEGDSFDLPMALSLRDRHLAIGRAGSLLSRSLPHLACLDFLPHLATGRVWAGGRHQIDADRALGAILDALRKNVRHLTAAGLSVPPYLTDSQLARLRRLTDLSRWKPLVSVSSPVAAVLAGCSGVEGPACVPGDPGRVLVGDVDGHAFTWSQVEVADNTIRLLGSRVLPTLGRAAWLRRILNGVSLRCVKVSRRDPRESGEVEQQLYDRLDEIIERSTPGEMVEVTIEGQGWLHHLMFQNDELIGFVEPLLQQTLFDFDLALAESRETSSPALVLLTPTAARLPGLLAGVEDRLRQARVEAPFPDEGLDFGEDLLGGDDRRSCRVHVLGPEALARAAHELAGRGLRGEMGSTHHNAVVLGYGPISLDDESGPARLNFLGQDHFLATPTFTLGRDPGCNLVFEGQLYPTVASRHCDIVFDRRNYTLYDLSRQGTLLNDRPMSQPSALHTGDWIRLGPTGPTVRFLGSSGEVPLYQAHQG